MNRLYKSLIRPLMEYGDVLWDGCTEGEGDLLEFVQYEAAKIVTGAMKGTSIEEPVLRSSIEPVLRKEGRSIEPVLRKEPGNLILHVGTNDLRYIDPAELAKSIQSLAINIEENSPNTSVSISAILPRKESQISKNATLVNNSLKLICSQHHWNFIEHKNIKQTHLNRGGIHLSKAGSDILANNFKFHINNE